MYRTQVRGMFSMREGAKRAASEARRPFAPLSLPRYTHTMTTPIRCAWATNAAPLDQKYHDEEWGVPLHNDRSLFEFICLEGAQAGLSWTTILHKREHYKKVFDNFDAKKIARYDEEKITMLLQDPGIIRNKLKVRGFIKNAAAFLEIQKEFGSFDAYLWNWVDGAPLQPYFKTFKDVPASTTLSEALSKDLKKGGFTFVGPTICYAFMQAVGMTNDHTVDCFRHETVKNIQ